MNPRIHVIHLRNTITQGGAERMLLNWCGHIDRQRFQFSIVCFANPEGTESCLLDPASRLRIQTFRIPWGRRKRLFSAVNSLVRIIRENPASILHSHDAKSDVVAWLTHLRTRIPVVGAAYAWFGGRSVLRNRVYEWLDASLLKQFHAVVAVSESLRAESIAQGLDPDRLSVIRTGVDFDSLQRDPDRWAVRRSLGLLPDDIVIGNLARLWPEKGQEFLVTAMCQVVDYNAKAKLVIVGNGPLESELRAHASALGIASHVVFAGFPPNLPDVLQVFDAQVHSSLYEGLPMALLQGMAAGLPIVATDVGGVGEVLRTGENALLVPPADAGALASAIIQLLRDKSAAQRMGEAARCFVRENYSMTSAMRQLETVYERVCRETQNSRRVLD